MVGAVVYVFTHARAQILYAIQLHAITTGIVCWFIPANVGSCRWSCLHHLLSGMRRIPVVGCSYKEPSGALNLPTVATTTAFIQAPYYIYHFVSSGGGMISRCGMVGDRQWYSGVGRWNSGWWETVLPPPTHTHNPATYGHTGCRGHALAVSGGCCCSWWLSASLVCTVAMCGGRVLLRGYENDQ